MDGGTTREQDICCLSSGNIRFFCDKDEELSNLHSEDDCPGTWVGLLIS